MTGKASSIAGLVVLACSAAVPEEGWKQWPPKAYLFESLAKAIPEYLERYHPETGRFGTEPWICNDQNLLFPLAAAWAIEDERNPWYHDEKLLEVIGGGGEALVEAMDAQGKWTFRKKDNSTWGQIHMPWTYSRWIRAYHLVRDALPEAAREKWERGLLLGFGGIRKYMDGGTHNIPTHHAMALYIAGVCFSNDEWKEAAKRFMARVVDEQDPVGFWSEHYGPVVGYNRVYVDALGVYYHFSRDPVVLEALRRSATFHASVLWPDGSAVSAIDERQIYHKGIDTGNVGFSWTPEGRGFLLKQVYAYSEGSTKRVSADYAASMLLYSGAGTGIPPAADRDAGSILLGDQDALIRRRKPWQWALSAYTCAPAQNRWIQDRQNLVDVYHDALGLVVGGGNTKLQPYWSTFTVGDAGLLKHMPGDTAPDFTPEIELRWTPDAATITNENTVCSLDLMCGDVPCAVSVTVGEDGALILVYKAPAGKEAEAHIPLLRRAETLQTATGTTLALNEEEWVLNADEIGTHVIFAGLKVSIPDGAQLRWSARQHNPYKKDGSSTIGSAKLVLVLPFETVGEYHVTLCKAPGSQ